MLSLLRTSIFVLALAVVIAGCSNDNSSAPVNAVEGGTNTGEENAVENAVENPYAEHYEFKVSLWDIGKSYPGGEDEFNQMIEDKFNVTIKPINVGWSDFQDKTKLWAASGELPDLFVATPVTDHDYNTYQQWIKQGIVRDIPIDTSKHPNLAKLFEQDDTKSTLKADDDKFYAIPRLNVMSPSSWLQDRGILIRKDWMEKLGLKDPTNFEEFAAIAKAFITEDPDGNGQDDTVGIVNAIRSVGPGQLSVLSLASDLPQIANGSWVKEDGKWLPYYASAKYPAYVTQLRKLYTEGSLYKDFALDENSSDKFLSGKSGIMVTQTSSGLTPTGIVYQYVQKFNELNPDKNWDESVKALHLWTNAAGDRYHHTAVTWWSETYLNKSTMDDKKSARALDIFEWLYSEEGLVATHSGIPDKDYSKDGQVVTATRAKDDKGEFVALNSIYPSIDFWSQLAYWPVGMEVEMPWITAKDSSLPEPEWFKAVNEDRQWLKDNTIDVPINFYIDAVYTPAMKTYNVQPQDDLTNMIFSKDSVENEIKKMLDTYNKKGLAKVIEEVNTKATEMGIE
jgi:putative aldouronate transport system substrate-binding protein